MSRHLSLVHATSAAYSAGPSRQSDAEPTVSLLRTRLRGRVMPLMNEGKAG